MIQTGQEGCSEVVKTVGVDRPDGNKDFDIYLMNGDVVRAIRNAGKFQVGDMVDTLRQIKILVMEGLRWEEGHDPLATGDTGDTGDQADDPSVLVAWDCVDPCALLVEDYRHKQIDPTLRRTLDCHGWIDPETGEPDYERALREIERFNKISKGEFNED